MERVKPDYLELTSKPLIDDHVEYKKWVEIEPQTKDLNTPGDITIRTNDTSQYFLLEESKFIIDIDITKQLDGSRYSNTEVIGLVNNAVMYMFDSAKLEFNGELIEYNQNLGYASTCLGHLSYGTEFSHYTGLKQGWFHESSEEASLSTNVGFKNFHDELIKDNDTKGTYTFVVPFNHVFAFQGKVLIGLDSVVTLKRHINNLSIYRATGTAVANLQIKRLVWKIPYLKLSSKAEEDLNSLILKETYVSYPFQQRECHVIPVPETKLFVWNIKQLDHRSRPFGFILFFQTESRDDQTKNPAIFDHCKLETARVKMNTEEYPNTDLRCDYTNKSFMESYDRFIDLRKKYTNTETLITPKQFKNLYPFYAFDISNQHERLTGSVSQIQVECRFKENVKAETTAYGFFLTDRKLNLQLLKNKSMKFVSFDF